MNALQTAKKYGFDGVLRMGDLNGTTVYVATMDDPKMCTGLPFYILDFNGKVRVADPGEFRALNDAFPAGPKEDAAADGKPCGADGGGRSSLPETLAGLLRRCAGRVPATENAGGRMNRKIAAGADDAPVSRGGHKNGSLLQALASASRRLARRLSGMSMDASPSGGDRWITVHPNGGNGKGRPCLIDKNGTVKAGMGGKFNGKKISDAHKGPSSSSFKDRSKKNAVKKKTGGGTTSASARKSIGMPSAGGFTGKKAAFEKQPVGRVKKYFKQKAGIDLKGRWIAGALRGMRYIQEKDRREAAEKAGNPRKYAFRQMRRNAKIDAEERIKNGRVSETAIPRSEAFRKKGMYSVNKKGLYSKNVDINDPAIQKLSRIVHSSPYTLVGAGVGKKSAEKFLIESARRKMGAANKARGRGSTELSVRKALGMPALSSSSGAKEAFGKQGAGRAVAWAKGLGLKFTPDNRLAAGMLRYSRYQKEQKRKDAYRKEHNPRLASLLKKQHNALVDVEQARADRPYVDKPGRRPDLAKAAAKKAMASREGIRLFTRMKNFAKKIEARKAANPRKFAVEEVKRKAGWATVQRRLDNDIRRMRGELKPHAPDMAKALSKKKSFRHAHDSAMPMHPVVRAFQNLIAAIRAKAA